MDGVTIIWALGFLIFDREAGRARPSSVTGLIVVGLALFCHFWLSGPWLLQAGFPGAPHSPTAAAPTAPSAVHSAEAGADRSPAASVAAAFSRLQKIDILIALHS